MKHIWVTGASSGIGRSLVEELLEVNQGQVKIWISSRSKAKLEEIKSLAPEQVIPLAIDLSSKSCVPQLQETFQNEVLDEVYFIAGGCEYIDLPNFDSEIFLRIMNQNFMSHVYAIEAALPSLRRSENPWLVGMSSSVAWTGLPRAEAYGSSKAAIYHLMQSLRADLKKEIDVSVICAGFVETPLTDLNDFPMPGKISSKEAARRIVKAEKSRPFEIHFPRRFTYGLKLLARMPQWIQDILKQKMKA